RRGRQGTGGAAVGHPPRPGRDRQDPIGDSGGATSRRGLHGWRRVRRSGPGQRRLPRAGRRRRPRCRRATPRAAPPSRARAPARRSLRAVIDWSHDLLDDEERVLFRRLSVFAGAFNLTAATAVAADGDASRALDGVARLTDKSLLIHRRDRIETRWHMLETIHA